MSDGTADVVTIRSWRISCCIWPPKQSQIHSRISSSTSNTAEACASVHFVGRANLAVPWPVSGGRLPPAPRRFILSSRYGACHGFLEPVRLALNGHNLAAVHQPVYQRHHAGRIGKHLVPFLERPVGGDDRAFLLMAPADELEQQATCRLEYDKYPTSSTSSRSGAA